MDLPHRISTPFLCGCSREYEIRFLSIIKSTLLFVQGLSPFPSTPPYPALPECCPSSSVVEAPPVPQWASPNRYHIILKQSPINIGGLLAPSLTWPIRNTIIQIGLLIRYGSTPDTIPGWLESCPTISTAKTRNSASLLLPTTPIYLGTGGSKVSRGSRRC